MTYVYAFIVLCLFFRWSRLLLLTIFIAVTTPFTMAFVVWFAKPTTRASGINCLPSWLSWFNTPDDPTGEQGDNEPAVVALQTKRGWRFKTWNWLSVRNQMYGLMWRLSPVAPAGTTRVYSNPKYPKSKNPYTPGVCKVTMGVGSQRYWELTACWGWPFTSKCANPRIGYKLAEMDIPGPVVFLFQPHRLWLTRDSTT